MPEKLPDGWAVTTLGEVCAVNPRPDADELPDLQTQVSFVPMSAVEEETGKLDASEMRSISTILRGYTAFRENDVVFAKITPCMENGKVALAAGLQNGLAFGSTEFVVFRPYEGVSSEYLLYFLLQPSFRREAERHMSGAVGQKRVPLDYLIKHPFPLPPIEEQLRIVAKLRKSLARLETGESAARRALERLKKYRLSVIYSAVTGELTADWRRSNWPDESGSILLQRLKSIRMNLAEDRQTQFKVEKNAKRRPTYLEPVDPYLNDVPILPKEWAWASLEMVAEIGSGMSVSQNRRIENPVEVPYLRVANVLRGSLDLTEVKKIRVDQEHVNSFLLEHGDILFNEGGDRDKLGRGWIWEGQIERCIHQNHVFRARILDQTLIDPKLISHWGNTFGQRFFIQHGKQSTNLASINRSVLAKLPVPIIPRMEQNIILKELESRLSAADQLLKSLNLQIDGARRTRQSLLQDAFQGRLEPQVPEETPAKLILDRIENIRKAEAEQPKTKRMSHSKKKTGRRSLLEVLRESKRPMTPELLFSEAGFQPNQAELFYRELASLRDILQESKPTNLETKSWPGEAKVLLTLRKEYNHAN